MPIALFALYSAAGSGGSPTYTVEGSFLLVVSPDASEDTVSNVIIDTPQGVNSVANVAVVVMHTTERRTLFADAGYASGYNFSVARNDPFVNFEVSDVDQLVATESAAVLARVFTAEMTTQQLRFGVDSAALANAELLEISEPVADYSSVRTGQAMVAAVGLLAAFMAAFAFEGVVYFFSDRRQEFHELDRYESDASKYGIGGESAADFRPGQGQGAVENRPEPAQLEEKTSSRWVRARAGRGAED
ncbi:MAG: hypothetical protein R2707_09375 [Acidimicrobiales bacterium]